MPTETAATVGEARDIDALARHFGHSRRARGGLPPPQQLRRPATNRADVTALGGGRTRYVYEIRVLTLARGTITWHTETLLSPCVPALEEPLST
ncbi:hypothetical protein [Streptomyces sp. NPDC046939]|uniref:hypothetical protein n=1 Tax=Streptomyces sp. NPDC046939 TaxID=3155376 RepID=UPI0033DCCC8D